jgi:uncharacterized membrane protein
MKTSRALVIGLIVSLGLNLLLAGVFLGRAAGPRPEMHRADPIFGMRRLIADLPAERAETLAPLYHDYVRALRPRFRDIRSTQRQLRDAMLTDPLDQTAALDALQSFQRQLTDSQRTTRKAFVALAAELTLSERQRLVENMDRRPDHWRGDRTPPQPDVRDRPPGEPPYHHIRPEPPPQ